MKLLTCLVGAAVLTVPVFGGPMTQDERNRALSEFHASRKMFLDAIEGLSPAQWNFKPDAAVWSAAECAEHIALSEDRLFGLVTKQMLSTPAAAGERSDITDEAVLTLFPDRSRKFQAPEMLQPKHQWTDRAQLTTHFKESRERSLDYLRTSQDDLRSHFFKHPAAGSMDAYQWLLTISAHCRRHTAQIEEVKANAKFPR